MTYAENKSEKSWLKDIFDSLDAGVMSFNLTKVGGTAVTLGQKEKTASIPVVPPSDWTQPVSMASAPPETDVNLTKVGGTAISESNPMPAKLPQEKGTEHKFHDAVVVSGSGSTAEYTDCRNYKRFIFAIKATFESGTPDMTFTLMEKLDDFTTDKIVKDIAAANVEKNFTHAAGTEEAYFKIDTESTGVLEKLFVQVAHVAGEYTVTSTIKPYR